MYWKIGTAEATMKGISTANFTSDIISGLNPGNTDLTKETNGLGSERQMRGWLEGKIPTPTQLYKIAGKNVTFYTVVAPMKKAADFEIGSIEGGRGIEIKFKNGEIHRLVIQTTSTGQLNVSFTSPKIKTSFNPQSNLDTPMDVNGGALPSVK